jgi:hypothetical protein
MRYNELIPNHLYYIIKFGSVLVGDSFWYSSSNCENKVDYDLTTSSHVPFLFLTYKKLDDSNIIICCLFEKRIGWLYIDANHTTFREYNDT